MATSVNPPSDDASLIAAADAVAVPADPTAWIKLLPAGSFTCRDGRGPFHAGDRSALEDILAETKALLATTDMMVDYDHQSILSAVEGVGGTAKAAGWIKTFEIRDEGLFGAVEWTDAASAAIKAREYRYISPLFTVQKTTGQVMALRNAALVNMPALDLEAIAARFDDRPPAPAALTRIAAALGLADSANETTILAAIAAARAEGSTEKTPDPAQYVPIAQVAALQADLATLKTGLAEDKAEALVTAAIAAGKLSPALKTWGLELATADPEKFEAFAAAAPQLTHTQLGSKKRAVPQPAPDPVELAAAASAHQAKLAGSGQVIDIAAAVAAVSSGPGETSISGETGS